MFRAEKSLGSAWFFFVIIYLVITIGRPQDLFPVLGVLRPGLLVLLAMLAFVVVSGCIPYIRNPQMLLFTAITLQLALYIPFTYNNFRAYQVTIEMLGFLMASVSMVFVIDSMKRLRLVVDLSILFMIYICTYSLLHQGRGPGSHTGDENDLSLYAVTMIPFAYYLTTRSKGVKFVLYFSALVVGLLSVVVSGSRGGFVGFVAMFSVIWFYSKKKMLTLLVMVVIGTGLFFVFADDDYRREMSTISNTQESTADARLNSWRAAWDIFVDHPWGVGGGNFGIVFPMYQSDSFRTNMWGRAAHSLWFTLLPELGILGVFLFFSLIIKNYWDLHQIRFLASGLQRSKAMGYINAMALSLLSGFAGFFAAGTFVSVLYYPTFWHMTALTVVVTRLYAAERERMLLKQPTTGRRATDLSSASDFD